MNNNETMPGDKWMEGFLEVMRQYPSVEPALRYGIIKHNSVSHTYDGQSYGLHLSKVFDFAVKYLYLLPEHVRESVLAAAWTHDVIEDCRETYNDVLKVCGKDVAELTYALTNEKGRNRKARANGAYYRGIRMVTGATFLKYCDRLANVSYSATSGSSMFKKYAAENEEFVDELGTLDSAYYDLTPMVNELISKFDELRPMENGIPTNTG